MPEVLTKADQVACPTCGTTIYLYNQHMCTNCGALTCYYCEADHARSHGKEGTDATTDTGSTGPSTGDD